MNRIAVLLTLICVVISAHAVGKIKPDISQYGNLPLFRSIAISPNGEYLSFIKRGKQHDQIMVVRSDTKKVVLAADIPYFKARDTFFVTDKYVLLYGSDTTMTFGYPDRFEHTGALVCNLETGTFKVLLRGTKDLHPAQTGLGKIVGFNEEAQAVYMPAYKTGSSPEYSLYKVSLDSGHGRLMAGGNRSTRDWFVDEKGNILAREEYNKKKKQHIIRSKLSGEWQTIYQQETEVPLIEIKAVGADGRSLLIIDKHDNREAVYSLSLHDGKITGPLFSKSDSDIDDLKVDINRKLEAVIYSGFKPRYEFVDAQLTRLFEQAEQTFPASSIHFESWTEDKQKFILFVSGGDIPNSYYLYDNKDRTAALLASQYKVSVIGEVKAIHYPARDGLKIPALLTLPPNAQEPKNLPLIAMPHGGPESYDQIGFDWMAQYFAARGYAVLQPNFRGSDGFGYAFRDAGRGRWGREMQDDITDGIKMLIDNGYVDSKRVCIVGGSYGGYAALAGGAFSPEIYRCIVAINGVSDLPRMFGFDKRRYGKDHWVIGYWHSVIGDSKTEIDKLEAISPINYPEKFQVPVLLIHGKDDTIVSIEQSKSMYNALTKAGKTSELKVLKGEDHWLSKSETRLEMLAAIEKFLDKYNPAD